MHTRVSTIARTIGQWITGVAWVSCAAFVGWLWFMPERAPASADRSPLATFKARSTTSSSARSTSPLAPASHRAREVAHWDVGGAGGLRGGVVVSPALILLTAPAAVYRLPLDGSGPPARFEKLRAAIGRPAAISLQRDADGADRVWVLSQESEQLALIDPREHDPAALRVIKAPNQIRQVRWLRNGTLVANGFFATDTLRLMNVAGDALTMARPLARSLFPEVPPDIAVNLNRNRVSVRADEERIAQAFLYVPRIHVYSPAGDVLGVLTAPDEIPLKYDAVSDPGLGMTHFIRTDETRYCYVDVASDLSHVYALFSGHSRSTDAAGAFEAELLDVFDWNGRFEGRWSLPYRSVGLVSDVQGRRLFILTRGAEPKVVQIALDAGRDRAHAGGRQSR